MPGFCNGNVNQYLRSFCFRYARHLLLSGISACFAVDVEIETGLLVTYCNLLTESQISVLRVADKPFLQEFVFFFNALSKFDSLSFSILLRYGSICSSLP